MSPRAARATAWGTFAITLVVYAVVFALSVPTRNLSSQSSGWSSGGGALWIEGVFLLTLITFSVVGVMIATRRPGNAIGWLLLGIGLAWGVANSTYSDYGLLLHPGSLPFAAEVAAIAGSFWVPPIGLSGTFLILLFPDGHLLSPRWRWVGWLSVFAIVVGTVSLTFAPGKMGGYGYPDTTNPLGISSLPTVISIAQAAIILIPVCMALSAASLVLRYRRSRGAERMQMKWLVAAAAAVATIYAVVEPLSIALTLHSATPGWLTALQYVALFSFFLVPVAIGFAVLRYRLFEIDVIIQKTLVYATLVAILATLYLGGIAGLGWIARTATGQSGAVAVTLSTLAVAAAFQPLRTRIQHAVDRRFYRAKYDAAETLEEFSSQLRRQIDLDTLHADVLGIVGSTMHPSHVSLWLRPTEPVHSTAEG
jgi:hypothetical protein